MKNKTIVVTGGSGFIATHLIKALKKESPAKIINLDLKTGYNLCDYRELENWFIENPVDIVFHLATLPLPVSLKQPYAVVNQVMKMTLNLCEIQRLKGFKRLIQLSSSEAYGTANTDAMDETHSLRPRTPYAAAKANADLIALAYYQTFGSDIIIPRSYNVYGPGQPLNWGAVIPKTIHRILTGQKPVIFKDGTQTRDFVFVKDVVKSIISIAKLDLKGEVINIGTGVETNITDLINLICKLMHYEGGIEYATQRVADVSRHCADPQKLYELTEMIPTTTLEKGLKETIDYYTRNIHTLTTL